MTIRKAHLLAITLLLTAVGSSVFAVPTAIFRVSTFDDFNKGEPMGTLISSEGEVFTGHDSTELKAKAAMFWSNVRGPDGTVYFGAGNEATLFGVKNNGVRQIANLKGLLVTSLALGHGGKILAAIMPGALVLEVDPQNGKWRQLAKVPAQHIWALLYDKGARTIYIASGAPGKLFSIPDVGGKPRVHYDPEEEHLLCLAQDAQGALLTGSADKAILYRVTGKDIGTALHDFDGTELKEILVSPTGVLYTAVNKFPLKTSGLPRFDALKDGEAGTPVKSAKPLDAKAAKGKVQPQELRPGAKNGKGALFSISPSGRAELLLSLEHGYFTDLDLDDSGAVWAGDGAKGKVYIIRPDRTHLTAFDFPQRQVLSLAISGPQQYIGTGDAGALYRISSGPGDLPRYISEVFDAKVPATWGNVHYQASDSIKVESRGGNTAKPDLTWSLWRAARVQINGVARITSEPSRYLQLKMTWQGGKAGSLRSFAVYYLPQNQRTQVTELTFEMKAKDKPKTPMIKIKWKVENPDEDTLVYRLYYREEMGMLWRRIEGPDPVDKTEYEWDTESVPDGFYRVKIVASDETDNPSSTTILEPQISERILIDNLRPSVKGLAVRFPWASGIAEDSYSPIKRIEYALDGKSWRLVGPNDGIFDSTAEAFRIKLPDDLPAGAHILAVRSYDEAENIGVSQVRFTR